MMLQVIPEIFQPVSTPLPSSAGNAGISRKGTTTATSVQGNTIANIVWRSSSSATTLPGVWSGIYVAAGNVNVGTVTGNTIGSSTGTGSISVTTAGNVGLEFVELIL